MARPPSPPSHLFSRGLPGTIVAQAAGRGLSVAANILLVAIAARCLPPPAFGEFMFALTVVNIAAHLADFGTNSTLPKLLVEQQAAADRLWGAFLQLRAVLGVVVALVAAVATATLAGLGTATAFLIGLCVPLAASRCFEPLFQIYRRPWYGMSAMSLYGVALAAGGGAAALLLPTGPGFLGGYALANAVYCGVAWHLAGRCLQPSWPADRRPAAAILRTSTPLAISAFFTLVTTRANILVLERTRGFEEVGLLAGAMRVVEVAVMLASLLSPLVGIFRDYANDPARLRRLYCEIVKLLIAAFTPVLLLAPCWTPIATDLLYGPKYAAAAPAMTLLSGVGAYAALNLLNTFVLLALGRLGFAGWLTGSAALVSITLNLLWIPSHGYLAAAWIALGVEMGTCAFTLLMIRRHLGAGSGGLPWVAFAAWGPALAVVSLLTPTPAWILAGAAGTVVLGCLTLSRLRPEGSLWRELARHRFGPPTGSPAA